MITLPGMLPTSPPGSGIAYRRYRGLEDIAGMAAANAAMRARAGVLEPIDIAAMEHRYLHLVNSDPLRDCVIVERDGLTMGYARVEWHDLTDGDRVYDLTLVVEPSSWGLGIEGALIDWCERRLREIGAGQAADRARWFSTYVFGSEPGIEDALAVRGYAPVRWDAEMLRPDLDDIPVVAVPEGYALRCPSEDELPAVFDMFVAAFAEHWGEYEAADQRYDDWVDDPRFRRDLVVVAWAGRTPAAAVSNFLEADGDGTSRGLLEGVATHPDHRRRGLARATVAESLRLLRDAGATSAYLGVDIDNRNQTLTLYESLGFGVASRSATWRRPFEAPAGSR